MNQSPLAGITLWAIPRFHRNNKAAYAYNAEQDSAPAPTLKQASFQPTAAPQLVLSETAN